MKEFSLKVFVLIFSWINVQEHYTSFAFSSKANNITLCTCKTLEMAISRLMLSITKKNWQRQ